MTLFIKVILFLKELSSLKIHGKCLGVMKKVITWHIWTANRTILHDENTYPDDPRAFKPERFLNENGQIDENVFNPSKVAFGAGRRYGFLCSEYGDELFSFLHILILEFVLDVMLPMQIYG
jgi:hypothetical protein